MGYALDEAQKNALMDLIEKYKHTKPVSLHPIFDEVLESLKSGRIHDHDAYQARFIRDSLAANQSEADRFKDISEYIEKTFFA